MTRRLHREPPAEHSLYPRQGDVQRLIWAVGPIALKCPGERIGFIGVDEVRLEERAEAIAVATVPVTDPVERHATK